MADPQQGTMANPTLDSQAVNQTIQRGFDNTANSVAGQSLGAISSALKGIAQYGQVEAQQQYRAFETSHPLPTDSEITFHTPGAHQAVNLFSILVNDSSMLESLGITITPEFQALAARMLDRGNQYREDARTQLGKIEAHEAGLTQQAARSSLWAGIGAAALTVGAGILVVATGGVAAGPLAALATVGLAGGGGYAGGMILGSATGYNEGSSRQLAAFNEGFENSQNPMLWTGAGILTGLQAENAEINNRITDLRQQFQQQRGNAEYSNSDFNAWLKETAPDVLAQQQAVKQMELVVRLANFQANYQQLQPDQARTELAEIIDLRAEAAYASVEDMAEYRDLNRDQIALEIIGKLDDRNGLNKLSKEERLIALSYILKDTSDNRVPVNIISIIQDLTQNEQSSSDVVVNFDKLSETVLLKVGVLAAEKANTTRQQQETDLVKQGLEQERERMNQTVTENFALPMTQAVRGLF